jgi:acetyl esterase/lipase
MIAFLMLMTTVVSVAYQPTAPLQLWPGKPPGETASIGEERDATKPTDAKIAGQPIIRLTNVSQPTLTLYPAPKEKRTGATVIVCPGGAYQILAMNHEGTEVCEWLNSIGVTAVLLKYRVPARPNQPRHLAALQDAQRAVSLVRGKAKEWDIDAERIGILGFSAGGHLTAMTATSFGKRSYEALDDVDKVSCRPDFAILIYPAYLVNEEKTGLHKDVQVTKETPPMFLVHAADDRLVASNSAVLYMALERVGVPAELHIYTSGGHGFGIRPTDNPSTTWPKRCEEWLSRRGITKSPAGGGR